MAVLCGLFVLAGCFVAQSRYFATYTSAAPSTLNFQARLLNASGSLVPDGNYNIEFKIYDSLSAGTSAAGVCSLDSSSDDCWWLESRSGSSQVRVKNGYFSVNLGSVTAFPSSVPWSSDLWLSMNIGGTPVTPIWDGEMTPRIKLTAVPYAFEADKLDGIDSTGLAQLAPSTIQSVNSALSALAIDQIGSGPLLDLRGNGVSALSLDKAGNATLGGGLTLGTSVGTTAGTLRWTGTDFEGYNGTSWVSLTAGGGLTNPVISKTKTLNESVNNSGVPAAQNTGATFQDDDELFFTIGANETWNFRTVLQVNANATPDIKFSITAPAGATCSWGHLDVENAIGTGNLACGASSGIVTTLGVSDTYETAGSITNGATPGVVRLRWAQNTANAANSTILAGSYLEAIRSVGSSGVAEAFIQGGNSFGATAVIGTNDANALSFETSGIERMSIAAGGGLNILAQTTLSSDLIANGTATGTTGTTNGAGTNTNTLVTLADTFDLNDVVLVDNVGQDYFARITADPGTGSYTVSPNITYTTGRPITKYNIQNVGASATDYSTLANRFFQGYFLGGVVVGAGSTTISDGNIDSTTDLTLQKNGGNLVIGGAAQIDGSLNITGTLTGDGAGLTNISGASINGATVTGINASNIASGSLSDSLLTSNVDLLNSTQTYSALKTFDAGLIVNTGQNLTVNGDALNDLTGTGLLSISGALSVAYGSSAGSAVEGNTALAINAGSGLTGGGTITLGAGGSTTINVVYGSTAGSSVEGNTALVCPAGTGNLTGGGNSITLGAGGSCGGLSTINNPTFATSVTSPIFTGSSAVTISSGGAADLTIDSASNVLVLSDDTLRRAAAGATKLELNNAADTNLIITNIDASAVANLSVEGVITATSYSGSGAGLTALNGSEISTGTIADSRLSANIDQLNLAQTYSALKTFGAGLTVTSGQTVTINGDAITDFTGTGLSVSSGSLGVSYGTTAGTSVQGSVTLTCPTGTGNLSGGGTAITLGAGGTCGGLTIGSSPSFSGSVSASSFSGDGSALTALTGSNIASGTISDLRLSTNVSLLDAAQTYSALKTFSAGLSITGGSTPLAVASGGIDYLTVDATGSLVRIGSVTGDTTGILLVLDSKTSAPDPTGVNGGQYYNSATGKFRCFENSSWTDCISSIKSIRKAGSTTRTNTATLAADPDLSLAMAANTTYYIRCSIYYDTQNAPDFKYSTSGPTGTLVRTTHSYLAPAATSYVDAISTVTTGSVSTAIVANAGSGNVKLDTIWQNGATPGTWAFNWAQNTSNGGATTVLAGSTCEYSTR